MFYYLEDHVSKNIFFISPNPYLINNLRSGILDCHFFSIDSGEDANRLLKHIKKDENNLGIKFSTNGLEEFPLNDILRNKQKLTKIRARAFTVLLNEANVYRSKNIYGFYPSDPFIIKEALTDQNRIYEYVQTMNITEEAARSELNMIIDSIYIDQFRLFTICNMWKKKINKITTIEECENIIKKIIKSFYSAGIPDA